MVVVGRDTVAERCCGTAGGTTLLTDSGPFPFSSVGCSGLNESALATSGS